MNRLFTLGIGLLVTLTGCAVASSHGRGGGAEDQRGEKYTTIYGKKSDAYATEQWNALKT